MSSHSISSNYPASQRHESPSWLLDRAFWGGISVVTMWLAVLFVGVFGSNIDKVDAGGGTSSVPVVVVVSVVALFGTIAIAHSAFGSRRAEKELRRAVEDERRDIDRLSAELEELRGR